MINENLTKLTHKMEWYQKGVEAFNQVMDQVLDLGQVSLPESQFLIFKKLIVHYFVDGKVSLSKIMQSSCGDNGEIRQPMTIIRG